MAGQTLYCLRSLGSLQTFRENGNIATYAAIFVHFDTISGRCFTCTGRLVTKHHEYYENDLPSTPLLH
jgi:hypothetical protein